MRQVVGADQLVDRHRRIGAERKERGGAEIHVAAIAAEDVPGGREHDILQDHVAGEEHVVVADRDGAGEHQRGDREADDEEERGAHGQRPNRPAGRTASVSNRKPNDTAGAQDGP